MKKGAILLTTLLCMAAVPDAGSQEVRGFMPVFYEKLKASLDYPLSRENCASLSFRRWQKKGIAKVYECLTPAPPEAESWDMKVLDSERRAGYTAQKIVFNVNAWCRVKAYLLIPDGDGPHPAVLALHDHGAHFTIGKEKMVRPFGVSPEIADDAVSWAKANYDGDFVGDRLAEHGYVVLAVDALFWGDRGREEGPDYNVQQALNSNLQQMGMSLGSFIVWDDLRSAEFLAGLPFVDEGRIATLGHSMGSHRAWMTCALSSHINACVAVCWMNTTEHLMTMDNNQNKGGSAYTMIIPGLRNWLDYPDVASLACPKPVYFMNGSKDKLFPVEGVKDAYARMRKVWEERGAASDFHSRIYDGPHFFSKDMQDEAIRFLDEAFELK